MKARLLEEPVISWKLWVLKFERWEIRRIERQGSGAYKSVCPSVLHLLAEVNSCSEAFKMSVNVEDTQDPISGDKRQAMERGEGNQEKKARVDQIDEIACVAEEDDYQPTISKSTEVPNINHLKPKKLPLFQRTPT